MNRMYIIGSLIFGVIVVTALLSAVYVGLEAHEAAQNGGSWEGLVILCVILLAFAFLGGLGIEEALDAGHKILKNQIEKDSK